MLKSAFVFSDFILFSDFCAFSDFILFSNFFLNLFVVGLWFFGLPFFVDLHFSDLFLHFVFCFGIYIFSGFFVHPILLLNFVLFCVYSFCFFDLIWFFICTFSHLFLLWIKHGLILDYCYITIVSICYCCITISRTGSGQMTKWHQSYANFVLPRCRNSVLPSPKSCGNIAVFGPKCKIHDRGSRAIRALRFRVILS